MILGDKIMRERKKNGWTQEELAELMEVSRQSVSKWESAQAIPDINKVIRLSELFGVSTDYLFKDELEEPELVEEKIEPIRKVSLQEANEFLQIKEKTAKIIALGTALCMLGVTSLIFLGGLRNQYLKTISEERAVIVGLIILLVFVTFAVSLFIYSSSKTAPYKFLNTDIFETEYGVIGVVKERQKNYQSKYTKYNIISTCLSILGVLPLLIGGLSGNEWYMVLGLVTLLIIETVAVSLFIVNGIYWESLLKLLQVDNYSKKAKEDAHSLDFIAAVYWPVIIAIYLGYSFLTNNWHLSWVIWPVAGVLFGAVASLVKLVKNKNS